MKFTKYLIALILITLPSYLIRFEIFGIPTTALEIAIYLVFTFYFLLFTLGKAKFYWPDRKWFWPIGLLVLGALIGVLVSPDKRLALGQFKGFIFDPILFALVLHSALRSKVVDRDWVVSSLIWAGVGVAAISWFLPSDAQGRLLSVFVYEVNPSANYLSLFLVPILVLAASRIKYLRPIALLQLEAVGFLLIVTALVFSESRGGLLGLGLGLLYLLFGRIKQRYAKTAVITLAVVLVALVGYLARPDLSVTPDSGRISSSNNIRYEIWTTTKEILTKDTKNFVFGVGLGNYQRYFTELTKGRVNYSEFIVPRALTPHNIFLAMWTNGGLVMLGAFVWILFLAFRSKQFLPAQAALVALIAHGLVDTPYFKNDLSVLFWVLIVLTMIGKR